MKGQATGAHASIKGTKRIIGVSKISLRFLNPHTQADFQEWYSDVYNSRIARRASLLLTPPWIVACAILIILGGDGDAIWTQPATRSSLLRLTCLAAFVFRLIFSMGVIFFKWERRESSCFLYPSIRGRRRRKMAKYPLIEPCLSSLLIVGVFSSQLVQVPSPCDWGIRFFWHQNLPSQLLMPYAEAVIVTVSFAICDLSFASTQLDLRQFVCYSCIVITTMLVSLTRSYVRELSQRQDFCLHNDLQDEAAALQMRMDPFRLSHLEKWFGNKLESAQTALGGDNNVARDSSTATSGGTEPNSSTAALGGLGLDTPMEWEIEASEVHFGKLIAAGGGGRCGRHHTTARRWR
jgi:hypothetical protein